MGNAETLRLANSSFTIRPIEILAAALNKGKPPSDDTDKSADAEPPNCALAPDINAANAIMVNIVKFISQHFFDRTRSAKVVSIDCST